MLDLQNLTPLKARLVPWLDKDARDWAVVVVKGTFNIDRDAGRAVVAAEQVPILLADAFHGEAENSSVKYGTDASPAKRGTDVVLVGYAYAGRAEARAVDVSLRVGPLAKTLRVVGERRYTRAAGAWGASSPSPFERMPLIWEKAWGGSHPNGETEWRNPVGLGLVPSEGAPLANLELATHRVGRTAERQRPVGFGFVAAHWNPRRQYGGTYDGSWQKERCPYLPVDFDDRFFSAAPEDQIASPHLRGGEDAYISGASPEGTLQFRLPSATIQVGATIQGQRSTYPSSLDTVLVEPDERRVILTWKASIPCARRFLEIERVRVTAGGLS